MDQKLYPRVVSVVQIDHCEICSKFLNFCQVIKLEIDQYTVLVQGSFEMFIKKVSINIFVEVRDRHNWGLFLVPDFLNTKPKRKLLFFLVKYNAALSVPRYSTLQCSLFHEKDLKNTWVESGSKMDF